MTSVARVEDVQIFLKDPVYKKLVFNVTYVSKHERDNLDDLKVDGKAIGEYILKKQKRGMCTARTWLGIWNRDEQQSVRYG